MEYRDRKEYIDREMLEPFKRALSKHRNKELKSLFLLAVNRFDAAEEIALYYEELLRKNDPNWKFDFSDFKRYMDDKKVGYETKIKEVKENEN